MAGPADRLHMCRLAAAEHPGLEVSDLEIARGGASFTADTLDTLRGQYPEAVWYLITGADMFLTLGSWWRFEDIAAGAVLCAAPRDAATLAQMRAYAAELAGAGARCILEDIPLTDVSSTEIRRRVAEGKEIETLVPESVAAYIREKGLYREKAEDKARDHDAQYIEIIRGRLTPARFAHSLAVAERAEELARRWGADETMARRAGILHDCTKYLELDEQLALCEQYHIQLDELERVAVKLLHSKTGAAIARHVFGEPEEVCNAIYWHTTGKADMTLLDKVLYMADYIEPNRDFDGVEELRKLAYTDLDQAMLLGVDSTIREMEERGYLIHTNTREARQWLLDQGVKLKE